MKRLLRFGATFFYFCWWYCRMPVVLCHAAAIPLMKGARGMLTPKGLSYIDYLTESIANGTSPLPPSQGGFTWCTRDFSDRVLNNSSSLRSE